MEKVEHKETRRAKTIKKSSSSLCHTRVVLARIQQTMRHTKKSVADIARLEGIQHTYTAS